MAFELNPAIFDTYDRSFPMPDIEGAMDRRKRRELAERQLQQQADIDLQNRLEKKREFDLRAAEWVGQDLVKTPAGELDVPATLKARELRAAGDAALAEQGVKSVLNPRLVPDEFAGPWTGSDPTATPEVPPTEEQRNSPQYWMARQKAAEEVRTRKAELDKLDAMYKGRQGLASARVALADVQKMNNWLLGNDPQYRPQSFVDANGIVIPEAASSIADRYNEIAPKFNAAKNLPIEQRGTALATELSNAGISQGALTKQTAVQRNVANWVNAAKEIGLPEDEVKAKSMKMLGNQGRLPTLPVKQDEMIGSGIASMEAVDMLLGGVAQFENEYGKGSFNRYLGFLPKKENEISSAIQRATDPKDQKALSLLAEFSGMRNGNLAGVSGKTVTANENERMTKQIGDVGDKNSLLKLEQFKKDKERDTLSAIKNHFEYEMPNLYRQWGAERGAKIVSPTGSSSTGKKVGRFTVEVVK